MATSVIRQAGEGERRWFYGGGVHTWKVTSEESGGALFMFEDEMTQGKCTPWHAHPREAELMYLIEGEIELKIGKQEPQILRAGGVSMVPAGMPHAFIVISPTARVLALQGPGSGQAFYMAASEPAGFVDGPVDFGIIAKVAEETGSTKVLGPPPFERV